MLKRTPYVAKKKPEIVYTQFTRVPVEIRPDGAEKVIAGRTFLFDLRPESVAVFSTEPLDRGTEIALVIEHPRKLFVKGEVMFCTLSPWNPRVITDEAYRYRVFIQFRFESQSEALAVQHFCRSI